MRTPEQIDAEIEAHKMALKRLRTEKRLAEAYKIEQALMEKAKAKEQ